MKNIIRLSLIGIIILLANATYMFGGVDEDCLCQSNQYHIETAILAVDSCDFFDMKGKLFDCKAHNFGADLVNNFDSTYIYTRRNISIFYDEFIFNIQPPEKDTSYNIEDIDDNFPLAKAFYSQIKSEFGNVKLFNPMPTKAIWVEFEDFISLKEIKKFLRLNEFFRDMGDYADLHSYNGLLQSRVENNYNKSEYWFYKQETNEFVITSDKVRKVEIYNLLGEKIISKEVTSNSLINLNEQDRVLFVVTYDFSNNIHTEKLIIN